MKPRGKAGTDGVRQILRPIKTKIAQVSTLMSKRETVEVDTDNRITQYSKYGIRCEIRINGQRPMGPKVADRVKCRICGKQGDWCHVFYLQDGETQVFYCSDEHFLQDKDNLQTKQLFDVR